MKYDRPAYFYDFIESEQWFSNRYGHLSLDIRKYVLLDRVYRNTIFSFLVHQGPTRLDIRCLAVVFC